MGSEPALHPDDIVASKADAKCLAVVERTHGDVDSHTPYPAKDEDELIRRDKDISLASFRRFMKNGVPPPGTILVRWQSDPALELLCASKVQLVDRSLLIGDIVKRNVQDSQSGVVLNTFTKCTLQPMCDVTYLNSKILKGILPPGKYDPSTQFCVYPNGQTQPIYDVPASELIEAEAITEESLVVYKDWIGRVEALTNNIRVRLWDNCVVEISDDAGEHPDGTIGSFCVGDIAKTKKGHLRTGTWIFGAYNANTPPCGTVVHVQTVGAEVSWIQRRIGSIDEREPPFLLEAEELESSEFMVYQRERRPNTSTYTAHSTVSNSTIDVTLGQRVRFRDLAGACLKYNTPEQPNKIPRLERQANLGYDLNVFDVLKFETTVSVQWQDLSITIERSIDLLPDPIIDDEHAAWPGEMAHSLRMVPLPNMSNVEQPERIGVVQAVNASERMANVLWLRDSHIHYARDPDEHGSMIPPVVSHSITPSAGVQEEISLYDIEAPGTLNFRRGDIVLIASKPFNTFLDRPTDTTWLGELIDTRLDGTLLVRLGAATQVQDVILRREECILAIRSDGTDHVDAWDEGLDDNYDYSGSEAEDLGVSWDSEAESEEEEEVPVRYEDENGDEMDEDEVENDEWESADEDSEDFVMTDTLHPQTPSNSHSITPAENGDNETEAAQIDAPPSYEILEGDVPSDHRFRSEPTSSIPAHTKRTQKEHKILRNPTSLPTGVYIRSWESRLDLLRCLIIGPADTPYAYAPFVVDFYLPPEFPSVPPQVFFHSWLPISSIGTLGRVNPNLYEDGKVCLSLLGTWQGTKGEGWSAARSTLLQVVVSLLGLVLVREPYYNEAGYEVLVGHEASKRSSTLYSERVYTRAKGFLITALTNLDSTSGLKGLEDVIRWTYLDHGGPKLLDEMIREVEKVLERSDGTQEADGLNIMSKGACIPLRRVLERLHGLAAASQLQ